jgi:hypothetical protein
VAFTQHIRFMDGPCAGQTRALTFDAFAPAFVNCGGQVYGFVSSTGTELRYYVAGGEGARKALAVYTPRDAFRAWTVLHASLNGTVHRTRHKVRAAGARMRRAVG